MAHTRTLVTGTPGWLGSRLVEVMCNAGPDTGDLGGQPDRNVRCLVLPGTDSKQLEQMPVEVVPGDLLDQATLGRALEGVDTVIHAAGMIHPRRVREFYQVNVHGTRNLLKAAADSGVRRLVYISSSAVGGSQRRREKLMDEGDFPRPRKHYAHSKHQAEQAVLSYSVSGQMETVILRPCWYYGLGQPARQTFFFHMIKKGNPFLFGNGENLRSLTYVDNLIQAILLAETTPRADGQIYWVADKRPYTTLEIYRTIAELLGVELKPRRLPSFVSRLSAGADGVLQTIGVYSSYAHVAGEMVLDIGCNIEKAEQELGYQPKVELKEGMRRSIEWCQSHGIQI